MNETATELPPPSSPTADGIGVATHMFLVLCVAMCAAFGVWAYYGKLDVVSMALGEVVPSTQIKSIQHLEGGIVQEIKIKEGQHVKRGQLLVILESTASGADVGELKISITGLRAEIARLEAEASGKAEPVFDADLAAAQPRLVKQTVELFRARRQRLLTQLASQKEAIVQRQQEIKEIAARVRNHRQGLKLLKEQIAISEELLKEELTNRYKHLDLLKEESRLQGSLDEDRAAANRAKSALKEARSQLKGISNTFGEEVRTELEEKRRRLEELTQRLLKYADSLKRTELRSPVDGVVKALYVFTRGGVVRPGAPVVDVVPVEDRLIVEAKLPTQDIGYVQAGQTALIKLASADAMRFGALEGTVSQVSPDTIVSEDGVPFYKVRIETERDYFERGSMRYNLFPGMQVTTSIQTGHRTILEYILAPFLYSMDSAMRER